MRQGKGLYFGLVEDLSELCSRYRTGSSDEGSISSVREAGVSQSSGGGEDRGLQGRRVGGRDDHRVVRQDQVILRDVLISAGSSVGGGGQSHHLATDTKEDVEELVVVEEETMIPQAHLVEVQVSRGTRSRTHSSEVERRHLYKTIHVVVVVVVVAVVVVVVINS